MEIFNTFFVHNELGPYDHRAYILSIWVSDLLHHNNSLLLFQNSRARIWNFSVTDQVTSYHTLTLKIE